MDHLRRPFMATRASFPQELFDEDLDRISSLNLSTYRMQLSWSRLHTSRGAGPESFDMEALERYRGFLTAMQDRGIEPMVTLLHYEEPLWVSEQMSWGNAKTIDDWLDFVRFLGAELGGLVDTWLTLNEPFVFASLGYLEGRCGCSAPTSSTGPFPDAACLIPVGGLPAVRCSWASGGRCSSTSPRRTAARTMRFMSSTTATRTATASLCV